jgi:hypothetical protein
MRDPLFEDVPHVVFRQRNHEVQAFPPQCADDPFAERIRLWTLERGFQHLESQVAYAAFQLRREDTVSVMDEEAIGVVRWDCFPQLLQCPVRGGMRRDGGVEKTAGRVFMSTKT